jgi:hypothetical protein
MREEDGWWLRPRKKRNNRAEGRVKAVGRPIDLRCCSGLQFLSYLSRSRRDSKFCRTDAVIPRPCC